MTRILPLALLPFLAACVDGPLSQITIPGITPVIEEPAEPPVPPSVMAALPPGSSPNIVLQNSDGCYLFSIEETFPPSGYPVLDRSGNPICETADPAAF